VLLKPYWPLQLRHGNKISGPSKMSVAGESLDILRVALVTGRGANMNDS